MKNIKLAILLLVGLTFLSTGVTFGQDDDADHPCYVSKTTTITNAVLPATAFEVTLTTAHEDAIVSLPEVSLHDASCLQAITPFIKPMYVFKQRTLYNTYQINKYNLKVDNQISKYHLKV